MNFSNRWSYFQRWRYRDTVLALTIGANFTQLSSRIVISPVVPLIIASFAISKSQIGIALSAMWATYALFQFPSGLLGDRFGERVLILVSLGLLGAGCLLLAISPSFVFFSLFVIFLGAGSGLYFVAGVSMLNDLFTNRGQALSFHAAGGSIAGLVTPIMAGYLGVHYGWRVSVLLGAGIALPVLALFAKYSGATSPKRPDESFRSRLNPSTLLGIATDRRVVYTAGLATIGIFTFQSIMSFFPTFLIEHRGFSPQTASAAFGFVFLLSTIAKPVAGWMSDAFDRDSVVALALLVTMSGLGFLIHGPTSVLVIPGIGLVGLGLSWPGVLQARLIDSLSATEERTGFGLMRTIYMFLGSSGSVVTGTAADVAGWTTAYGIVIGILGLGTLVLLLNRMFGLGL